MGFWSSTRKAVGAKPKRGWVALHRGGKLVTDVTRFIDCIESGRESEMSAKDAAAVVEVLMASYVSAASGEPVSLPLPR